MLGGGFEPFEERVHLILLRADNRMKNAQE